MPFYFVVKNGNVTIASDYALGLDNYNVDYFLIMQYKFQTGDQVGTTIYNYATRQYDLNTTAANMISTSQFVFGKSSLYLDGVNYATVNATMLSNNATANKVGINNAGNIANPYGFYPSNSYGYTITCWAYPTVLAGGVFAFCSSNSNYVLGMFPNDRISFGPSNYNPVTWGANGFVANKWYFLAIVFQPNSASNTVALSPTFYIYGNNALSSYIISPQVGNAGTLQLYSATSPYQNMYIGYNGNAAYVSPGAKFQGYIADFRMYGMSLSQSQINSVYSGSLGYQ